MGVISRLGVSLGAMALSFCLAEGLLRLLSPPPPEFFSSAIDITSIDENAGTQRGLFIQTEEGMRLRPGATFSLTKHPWIDAPVTIRVNSLGFRGPEVPASLPPKTRKVLFLGDSITVSTYLREEDTLPNIVASKSAFPIYPINAGVSGAGIEDELSLLRATVSSVNPDEVLLLFYLNDASPSPRMRLYMAPRWLSWSRFATSAFASFSILKHRIQTPPDLRGAWIQGAPSRAPDELGSSDPEVNRFYSLVLEAAPDWGSAWYDEPWRLFKDSLREMVKLSEKHHFKLKVAALPVRAQVESKGTYDLPQQRFRALCKELEIPFLDLLPPLRDAYRGGVTPLFFDHCHLTAKGVSTVASPLAAFVSKAE